MRISSWIIIVCAEQLNLIIILSTMERWRRTWLTISLLVPLAKKASPSCEKISCDQVEPFPPVGVFDSEWILDSEPRTKNSCFATSYPGPRLYALLPVGARRRLQLLKVDSSTSSLSFKLCRPQPLSIFIKLLKNKYTLFLNYFQTLCNVPCISCISSRPSPLPRSQSTWLVVSVILSHRSRL